MMRDRRLRKLEAAVPPLPSADTCHIFGLLWFAIANYFGNPSPNEKPFEAFARALGYANETELNKAMTDRWSQVSHKFSSAEDKLFEKFEISLDIRTMDDALKFERALERMQADLPKSYKDALKRVLSQPDINLAWILEHDDLASYFRCFA